MYTYELTMLHLCCLRICRTLTSNIYWIQCSIRAYDYRVYGEDHSIIILINIILRVRDESTNGYVPLPQMLSQVVVGSRYGSSH